MGGRVSSFHLWLTGAHGASIQETKLRRALGWLFLLTLALGLSACASMSPEELHQGSLVFGGVNMDDAPSGATAVVLKIVVGKDAGKFFHLPVKKGIFYHEGLPVGSYEFYSVIGQSGIPLIGNWHLFGEVYEYQFGGQSGGVRVTRGGSIFYAGAFRIVKEGGWFSSKFSVQEDKSRPVKQMVADLLTVLKDPEVQRRAALWYSRFK